MDNGYYYYQQPMGPEVPVAPGAYTYGQYGAPRSKTPTSLVNHTGLSPGGPLSTPPPMSRDASRGPDPPPGQYPEQMVYGDSASNSPTSSVKTPDNDSFEDLALDAHPMPLTEALNATMAAHPQHFPPQQFNPQMRPQQSAFLPQQYNNYPGQSFTHQAAPWNSEQPMRSPDVPRSDVVVFDPVTDQVDYSAFMNPDVDFWTMHNTDPNYLISPNEPVGPPQDLFSVATQNMLQQQQQRSLPVTQRQVHTDMYVSGSSPVEMRLHRASPSPSSQRFAPYERTPTQHMVNRRLSHQHPSPIATSIELPTRMTLQSPASPYASASSPGGSDGMISSYQHSEQGSERRESQTHQPFGPIRPPPSSLEFSPSRTLLEAAADFSPDPEGSSAQRQVGPIRSTGRPGGRALGTHLEPRVAKAAHDMRKIVACWHCVLQRDKCGPGDVCERCLKRAQRPNADCGLGCSRIKLIELSEYFLPTVTMQIHEDSHLTHFVSQFIHQWGSQEICVYMTCEQKKMPRMPVKVYEFQPRGEELLVQLQYQTNPVTQERYTLRKRSPALGMVHINHNEEKKYDKYLNDIVDNHLDAFGEICWAEDDNDFSPRLFKLMTRVKPKSDDEVRSFSKQP
ncbi:uncharacterized protein N0V89_012437 [Didymosphaeria variabile]|uniref:Uncharacterized protein n=1 Tax=Didymosphaeria variabile TaxID=1932322 RepID=A0A9W8X996_9PLEO|nr:uncharacterized protein N0V89_012437 [Didymosphaeria variabile]KAJ4344693.1 hypothetical protein N0V89_012437 [Didymosphaeria variabile]